MKKTLVLILFLGASHFSIAQSSLYQNSKSKTLDDNFELYQKQLFSASRFQFESFKESQLDSDQKIHADFHHAISALKIEDPGASDLVYFFIRNNPDHPKINEAAHVLGNFFFEGKNYKGSIPAFKKVIIEKIWPEQRAEVLFKTGYSYFQLKDNNNALVYFNQVKGQSSEYRPDAFYYAGFIAMESGNYDQAIKDFREADKTSFYSGKVPYMLSGLYYRQGYYDELIAYAEPVLSSRKTLDRKEEIHLYLAEGYFEKRDFVKAAANYDAFVNARKRDLSRPQIYKAGIAQFETKNYQRSTDYFKVVATGEDDLAQVSSYYLGHAYLKLNNPQFASNSFNAAYKSDADPKIKEEALINYAKVNLERGSFQDAVTALDTYLENYPRGSYAQEAENLLTDALVNTNNYLRAIDQIEKMPRRSARINAAYQKIAFYQGLVYYRDKSYDLSISFFDKSLTQAIDRDLVLQAHFWKGENFAARQNLPQAISAYEALQKLNPKGNDPTLIKSHYGLGYAFFNSQQYGRAESQYKSYVDKMSGNAENGNYDDALMRLGDIYYVQKKFPQSLAVFQRAILERNANIDYAYFRSGVLLNFQSRNTEAISQLDQLINNFPSSLYIEDAIYQKSQINMEETQYAEARDGFAGLISIRPNSQFIPFALEGRAIANFSLQNYDATIDDYKRILGNHPNSSNAEAALVGLQETLALQGRSGEFSQYLSRYRGANPDNKSLQNLEFEAAKNLFFSNSLEQSIKAFNDYLRNYPQSGLKDEATFFIGDANYRLGRKEQALASFYEIDKVKDSPERAKAIQRIASIELENKNYSKALPYLRASAKNARNKTEEHEAYNGLMKSHYFTNNFDSAVYYSDRLIQLGSVTPDAIPEAMLLKGKAYRKAGKNDLSDDALMALVNEYKTVQGAEGLFLLAESYHLKGNYVQSNEAIFDFSDPFSAHDFWYGKGFILLAENYIKLGEEFQAKATLESVVERSTNEEIKTIAREKLAKLK